MDIPSFEQPLFGVLIVLLLPSFIWLARARECGRALVSLSFFGGSALAARRGLFVRRAADFAFALLFCLMVLALARPVFSGSRSSPTRLERFDIQLIIDLSLSMDKTTWGKDERRATLIMLQNDFVSRIVDLVEAEQKGDYIGLMGFGDERVILWPLSRDYKNLRRHIPRRVNWDRLNNYRGTRFMAAFAGMFEELENSSKSDVQIVIMSTDGMDSVGDDEVSATVERWKSSVGEFEKPVRREFILAGIDISSNSAANVICKKLNGLCLNGDVLSMSDAIIDYLRNMQRGTVLSDELLPVNDYRLQRLTVYFACAALVLWVFLEFLQSGIPVFVGTNEEKTYV